MQTLKCIIVFFCTCLILSSCVKDKPIDIKVLQLNLWHQAETVPNGIEGTIDIIDQTDPDIVMLCELKKGDRQFIQTLIQSLNERGKSYYADEQYMNVGILSKYKPVHAESFLPTEDEGRPIVKVTFDIAGNNVLVYSAHLDYQHYECYLPRGYSGATWQKIDAPVTDADSVLAANRISLRDEAISYFIKEAQKEIDKGNIVILGGDFNEPSHLDWQADTKDLYDHNGAVINWDCSVMLIKTGYKDSYREIYPSAVTHPAFTFPAGNKDAELKKLTWAPEADERDKIDFVYYYPNPAIQLKEAYIVGPSQSVAYGKVVESESKETFIEPELGVWPTDHKGNMVIFELTQK